MYFKLKLGGFIILIMTGCAGENRGAVSAWSGGDSSLSKKLPLTLKIVGEMSGARTVGGGVWLGDGYVLTAAHIIDELPKTAKIQVIVDSFSVSVQPVLVGRRNGDDLAVLKIDDAISTERLQKTPSAKICTQLERVGERLLVKAYDADYVTYASPDGQVFYRGESWSTATTTLASPGVSGSPVYNLRNGCLAGIMSGSDISKGGGLGDEDLGRCVSTALRYERHALNGTCSVTAKSIFVDAHRIATIVSSAKGKY